ncbi:MAG: putative dipeptidyl peptidase [Gemmatimonadetes bacterium]|nr:putative dipeptidyl peptidase [Gemmatimonadota bacterium]
MSKFALVALATLAASAAAQSPTSPGKANWLLANRYSTQSLRNIVFTTSVQPRWLGKTDSMFYNWKNKNGSRFYLVVPATTTRRPLFDHDKLAAQLAEMARKPVEGNSLPFTTLNFTKDHKAIRFQVDSTRYEWTLASETLRDLGKVLRDSVPQDEEREAGGGGRGGGGGRAGGAGEFRNFSPDSTAFVFARNHQLFIVENLKGASKGDTTQISTDGVKDYSFGFRDTAQQQLDIQQQQQQDDGTGQQGGGGNGASSRDPRVRANVVWSPDSKGFAFSRNDQRKVRDLYLVNVLAEPRPALMTYKYDMPGEADVGQQELWFFRRGTPKVAKLDVKKWKDQRLMSVHFPTSVDRIRLVRRDRLQRNLDVIDVDAGGSNAVKTLFTESLENAALEPQQIAYTKKGGDLIWWSERSGWGQYYLYDSTGKYKRPLTTGAWHAENIAGIDSVKGVVWIGAEGREAGENPYYRHYYRVNADGTGLALMDEGNFSHTETLSPTRQYMVDNYSRIDTPTRAVLRNASGKVVMNLEEVDVSRLKEMGWKAPETFQVKSADGVTDIYGDMWKPFDFDSTKKYPIIAYVYPGPQTESIAFTFAAGGVTQQLAQLGFIVIEIGNRGGSPQRSLVYHRYGYYNLRDYALADKKAGIEQLAARHRWIDIDKVGIYGHSGGGFLTAAALMSPGYNDFFKVGVSSSGNHDNNIYDANWSENNHGL